MVVKSSPNHNSSVTDVVTPTSIGKVLDAKVCIVPAPADLDLSTADFLQLLFEPDDWITIRLVQSWEEENPNEKTKIDKPWIKKTKVVKEFCHTLLQWLDRNAKPLHIVCQLAKTEKANLFFGVNPRAARSRGAWNKNGGSMDFACHVPLIRNLYADLDNTTPEEALKIAPKPSIIISSGNGCHVYWRLREAVKVPHSLCRVFKRKENGKTRTYHIVDGKEVNREPTPSAEADHVSNVLAGLGATIAADHCIDLARLLRLIGVPNFKGFKNGKPPRSVTVVAVNDVTYDFADFAHYAKVIPKKTPKAAKTITPGKTSKSESLSSDVECLAEEIKRSDEAPVGSRSECDFALCAKAIGRHLDPDAVFDAVKDVGKFAERGFAYFDRTWSNAENNIEANFEAANEEFAELDAEVEAQILQKKAKCLSPAKESSVTIAKVETSFSGAISSAEPLIEPEASASKRAADVLARLARERVELWHTTDFVAYATLPSGATVRVNSSAFRRWLTGLQHDERMCGIGRTGLDEAVVTLDSHAQRGHVREVYLRYARLGNTLEIDLCDDTHDAVVITPSGWSITRPSCRFVRQERRKLPILRVGGNQRPSILQDLILTSAPNSDESSVSEMIPNQTFIGRQG